MAHRTRTNARIDLLLGITYLSIFGVFVLGVFGVRGFWGRGVSGGEGFFLLCPTKTAKVNTFFEIFLINYVVQPL
jgi:hypothetical protein